MKARGLGRDLGKLNLTDADVQAFIQEGLAAPTDSRAHYLAQQMQQKLQQGEKLSDYDETVTPRAIYLGPEAISPYTFIHTEIQGSTSEKAPIHLEMTYTMVK